MPPDLITREQKISESVELYVKARLAARGYPVGAYEWRDSFPERYVGELTNNLIAPGYNFDDDGRQAELGSDLMVREYVFQLWVFGQTGQHARNLAHAIKFAAQGDGVIPLLDISVEGRPPFDAVEVLGASSDEQAFPDPEPWQEHVWVTSIRVEDTYYASLA